MFPQTLYLRIVQTVTEMGTTVPMDEALIGASTSKAMYIDAEKMISTIARSDFQEKILHSDWISAGYPPLASENIFLEFNSRSVETPNMVPGAVGVHVTTYETASKSHLFFQFGKMDERFTKWPRKYVLVIYRDLEGELSVMAAGAAVALDNDGRVSEIATFPTVLDNRLVQSKKHHHDFAATIAYTVFSCFGMINQGEVNIIQVAPNHWVV